MQDTTPHPKVDRLEEPVTPGPAVTSGTRQRTPINWTAVGALASILTVAPAVVGLFFAGSQIQATKRVTQAELVMTYFELLQRYNPIHQALGDPTWRPEPEPSEKSASETTRYMGLLEQVWVFLDGDVLPLKVADNNYSHRMHAVYSNDWVRDTHLTGNAERWCMLVSVIDRLETMPVYQRLQREDAARRSAPLPVVELPQSCTDRGF